MIKNIEIDLNKFGYVKYIDGIRAISLFLVILFHLDKKLMPAGYLGVDIFYVLSGYLISLSLYKDYLKGKISLRSFYFKRIKRLYPSLFMALIFTILGTLLILPKSLQVETFKALLATLTISSNIFFMQQGDYFSPKVDENPLIHTWSLGVEEQFYLVFPFLFLFLLKKNKALMGLSLIAILSIFMNLNSSFTNFELFYLTPSRFYQFMFGVIVLLFQVRSSKRILSHPIRNILTSLFFSFLVICCLNIWEADNYSFLKRFVVSLCVVLVLWVNDDTTIVSKVLNHRYFSYLGKSSYTTYLFHWPVIVFIDGLIAFNNELYRFVFVFFVLFSISAIQYNFFEKKITYAQNINIKSFLKKCLLVWCFLFFSSLGLLFLIEDKRNFRDIYPFEAEKTCHLGAYFDRDEKCMGADSTNYYLTLGNSHEMVGYSLAHHYLKNHLPSENSKVIFGDVARFAAVIRLTNLAQTAGDICKFVWDQENKRLWPYEEDNEFCFDKIKHLNYFIENPKKLKGIVISSFDVLFDEHISMLLMTNYLQSLNPSLKVIIVGHLLRFKKFSCRELYEKHKDPKVCNQPQYVGKFDLKQEWNIRERVPTLKFDFIDLVDLFCESRELEGCEFILNENSIYIGKHHFNMFGINEVNKRANQDKETYEKLFKFFKE